MWTSGKGEKNFMKLQKKLRKFDDIEGAKLYSRFHPHTQKQKNVLIEWRPDSHSMSFFALKNRLK